MYFGTPDVLHKGSTALHKDATAACNILVYAGKAGDGQQSGALWLIFDRQASKALSTWLREYLPQFGPDSQDPCHASRVFVDGDMLTRLKDAGICPFRFYQRPGQAVFIPAGCAHQVCACSYLSPGLDLTWTSLCAVCFRSLIKLRVSRLQRTL